MQDQPETTQVVDSALQTSIDSLLTEDQEAVSDTVDDTPTEQSTTEHWLPSVANSHAPVQKGEAYTGNTHTTPHQEPR